MEFPLIKIVRALLEADEYSFLFSQLITQFSELFPEFTSGVISHKDGKYFLNAGYPVKEWIHFPINLDQDLDNIPTDCFFKKISLELPEINEKELILFPLEADAKKVIQCEGWFFISQDILKNKEHQEKAFLFVEIMREAINKINKIERIKELTIIDEVTGLYNTRHLFNVLEQAVVQSGRYYSEFSLIFLDIDHFKTVNDTYGHLIGSKLLKELGGVIKDCLRKVDLAFRYGGDEFVVYLPYTSKPNAKNVVERLWQTVRNHKFVIDGVELNITASYGTAGFPEDGKSVKEIIERADNAMYYVKKNSRDAIEMA